MQLAFVANKIDGGNKFGTYKCCFPLNRLEGLFFAFVDPRAFFYGTCILYSGAFDPVYLEGQYG